VGNVSRTDSSAQALLDRWRASGADRLNRVRFHFVEALHRRTASQTGEARRILDARLDQLVAAYASEVERVTAAPNTTVPNADDANGPECSALAELLAHVARHANQDDARAAAGGLGRHRGASPELKMLEDVRETWSRVSAEKQFRQSLDQVPTNAGPLNSSSLVHRSLLLMREASPEYLRQFLSYVDALSWLERMSGDNAVGGQDAARSGGKTTRNKSR